MTEAALELATAAQSVVVMGTPVGDLLAVAPAEAQRVAAQAEVQATPVSLTEAHQGNVRC